MPRLFRSLALCGLSALLLSTVLPPLTYAAESVTAQPAPATATPYVLHREGWSFDRNLFQMYQWAKPEAEMRKAGVLNNLAGWAEYDFELPQAGWYELWEKCGVPGWSRDVYLDGQPLFLFAYSTKADIQKGKPSEDWYKEANLYLKPGKHTLRFRRLQFPGVLPSAWELRAGDGRPEACLRATGDFHNVVPSGTKIKLPLLGGTSVATSYELVLLEETAEGDKEAGSIATIDFPVCAEPVVKDAILEFPKQGVFFLLPKVGGKLLRPADLKAGKFIVVDTKNPPAPAAELQTSPAVDIDCVAQTINGQPVKLGENYFEKDGATTVVEAPFGKYRQSSGQGRSATETDREHLWGLDGFSYRFDLPDTAHAYRLTVTYPDDTKRTCGFWINDGADGRNGVTCTGGVETGGLYRNSGGFLTHEAFIYPLKNKALTVAVLNLNRGCKAAASRIVIERVDSSLPAAAQGPTAAANAGGRVMGFYFEEPGRWTRFFGAERSEAGHQGGLGGHLASLDRWGQWNRFLGANLMFPTINVYQGNHYPSRILDGYFSTSEDETRMVALMAQKYGSRFIPEFHLSGQTWFDKEVMGVWTEEREVPGKKGAKEMVVKFRDPQAQEYVICDRNGDYRGSWKEFLYNSLHPKVQQMYINVFGELADRLGDIPAFAGISSRLMLSWQWQGWNALPGLDWGYDDWTVAAFTKDTGVAVPGKAGDPGRFRARFDFLTGPALEQWQDWRCAKIFDFHKRLRDRIQKAKPDAKLFFNYFGNERGVYSHTQLGAMREFGLDWRLYAREPGMVIIPNFLYGRRMSTPVSDAEKVEPLYSEDIGGIARLGDRGFALYSDYFECNDNLAWEKLGGKKGYNAFDACAPAGLYERQGYAVALANNDTSFFINGGNGWIFGTPRVMQPFLREYRALPAKPFEPFPAGRDPAAVWLRAEKDGLYFYAVNRLPVALKVKLTLAQPGKVVALATGDTATLNGDTLEFTLEPYMLKSFRADAKAKLTACATEAPADYIATISPLLDGARALRDKLRTRQIAPELPDYNATIALTLLNGALLAGERREWAAARDNLARLPIIRLYSMTGDFPAGIYPRPAQSAAPAPKLSLPGENAILGDVRGRLEKINDLVYDTEGRLWATSDDQVMLFDRLGNYLRSFRLTRPHEAETGDARSSRLADPVYASFNRLRVTPDKRLSGVRWETPPALYETFAGRLLDLALDNKILLPNQTPKRFTRIGEAYAIDARGDLYAVCPEPKELTGVYKYRPDGTGAYDFTDPATGQRTNRFCDKAPSDLAFNKTGHCALAADGKLLVLDPVGKTLATLELPQTRELIRLSVTQDGTTIYALANKGHVLVAFRRDGAKLSLLWTQPLTAPASAIACGPDGVVTVGFAQPVLGQVAFNYRPFEKGAVIERAMIAGLPEAAIPHLNGFTQLKIRDGKLYYLSSGKLMRLLSEENGAADRAEIAFDPQIREKQALSFAFAPGGDLYLAGHYGFYGNTRGINVYLAKKQGEGWAKPEQISGKPLFSEWSYTPTDIEIDKDGGIIVRLPEKEFKSGGPQVSIFRYNPQTGEEKRLCYAGPTAGWGTYGLHTGKDGKLFIAGGGTRSLFCLDPAGKEIWHRAYREETLAGTLPLRNPQGITTDSKGRVWVSDLAANQILCFDPHGALLGKYGTYGTQDNRDGISLCKPVGIAALTDASGQEWLYVADVGNQRILKLRLSD